VVGVRPHLLHLCRSIHGNPVKDGLVADPADWPYSNYQEWTGQRNGSLYDPAFVRANFPSSEDYRAFVFADLRGVICRMRPKGIRNDQGANERKCVAPANARKNVLQKN
jgi:hypothetical protein